jgi:hypothetical protein
MSPIYQTNLWVCDNCKKMLVYTEEVATYDDPTVRLPEGEPEWGHSDDDNQLLCVDCLNARHNVET